MKEKILIITSAIILLLLLGCKKDKDQDIKQLTVSDLVKEGGKESYVIGVDLAKST